MKLKVQLQKYFSDKKIKRISFDSRLVKPGDAFFAIKGECFNGNDYIDNALALGASVVFTDDESQKDNKIVHIEDARRGLAMAAGMLYSQMPENIIAVTGTNGKSSVVSYVHQIFTMLGKSSASMGTLGVESTEELSKNAKEISSGMTSSDPLSFRKTLSLLARAGVSYLALEASSHGLHQFRLGEVKANGAAFTSFSQDHLEYHHTMEEYLLAKMMLFTEHLADGCEAVINSEMESAEFIGKFLDERDIPYSSVGANGDLQIKNCQQSIGGQRVNFSFLGEDYSFSTEIIGSFQATNILIAAKLVYNMGIEFGLIAPLLSKIKPVCGRLQRITEKNAEYQVFVDYAHTPDALEKSLIELEKLKQGQGQLYVVFGCGGDRDSVKRPIMGKIATDIADYVVITDDNPRDENAEKIRGEILKGLNYREAGNKEPGNKEETSKKFGNKEADKLKEIADRKLAINETVAKLKQNDILLIAGKGHEDYQIIGDIVIDFSDIDVAFAAIRNRNMV
ncbi:MAG: UDP-N-acetylmuramoyl-L-alanyl-D-glutamate--2,6-diaminopimelate ligase [Rickettsiales bacterium]|nr:MAG: UDP-N-acetylmuramoyl-L-alanyl-D-glutamate--2,6-diaminopimelate ligase [Rickettsiales bacterium]